MIKGSCCCKAVQFELNEAPKSLGTCHCSRCRKVGASTIFFTKIENFKLIRGQEYISTYQPEEGNKYSRNFCSRCGSSLGEMLSGLDSFPLPANLLDSKLELKITFNEFIEDKPSWVEVR